MMTVPREPSPTFPVLSEQELLVKYDVPGPRYTSYPTVPCWGATPTEREWVESVRAALRGPAAVYIHVPFCRSLCTYCGCNTRITRKAVGGPYVGTLLAEAGLLAQRLGVERLPIGELHLGGGTPTFLTADELARLIDGLAPVPAHTNGALSLEADPRVTTREQLAVLAARGFTRLSLGVQDFDPTVQHAIHRVQSEAQVRAVTEAARSLGFDGVGYDLVYGLPHQTLASIEATIEAVVRLAPDRIAFYGYAHVPWVKKAQRGFEDSDLPLPALRRRLYERGRDLLAAAGYVAVAMDHFARPADPLARAAAEGRLHRNFMGYTDQRTEPLIGLGASAIGDSGTAFAQNEKDLEPYVARVEAGELPIARGHLLDAEDRILREHILALMTRYETRWQRGGPTWTAFLDSVGERLAPMIEDRLVVLEPGSCRLTERGRSFVRNACMAFDARIARRAPVSGPTFSRTV